MVADRARRGDRVIVLSRHPTQARALFAPLGRAVEVVAGDARFAGLWQTSLERCDAILHLAGHNTARDRWTARIRREIRVSRVESARRLLDGLRMSIHPPAALIVASTVAAFGDRGGEQLDDRASYGCGFLAGLMAELESECARAESLGARVVALRLGSVLDAQGGMIPRAAPWFRRGCGVIPGTGSQFVPWIHWRDVVQMLDWAIGSPAMRGTVNAVAPEAVQWSRLSNELATRCGARGVVTRVHAMPAFVLRVLLGQGAAELLASRNAVPSRALMHGFQFQYPLLSSALDECCAEWRASQRASSHASRFGETVQVAADAPHATSSQEVSQERVTRQHLAVQSTREGVLVDLDHGLSATNGHLLPEALAMLTTIAADDRAHIGLFSQRPIWELPDLASGPLASCAQLLSGGTLLRTPSATQSSRIPTETIVELLKRLGALAPRIGLVFEHPDGFDTPEPNRLRHPQHGNPIFITRVRAIAELEVAETMRIHLVGGAEERGTVVEWLMREFVAHGTLSIEAKSPWIVSIWATAPTRALAHAFALHAGIAEDAHAMPVRSIAELRRAFRGLLAPETVAHPPELASPQSDLLHSDAVISRPRRLHEDLD